MVHVCTDLRGRARRVWATLILGCFFPWAAAIGVATDPQDWNGTWILDRDSVTSAAGAAHPVLTPAYRQRFDQWAHSLRDGTLRRASELFCQPPGMPALMRVTGFPVRVTVLADRVTTQHGAWAQQRTIYTDGRAQPAQLTPTDNGYTSGHWEGGTLVAQTIGLRADAELLAGVGHSSEARVSERIYLASRDELVDEMTIFDARALEQPWPIRLRFKRSQATLKPFACREAREPGTLRR